MAAMPPAPGRFSMTNGLLEVLADLVREQPDGHVAGAARPVGHQDADRPAGKIFGRLGAATHKHSAHKRAADERESGRGKAKPTRNVHRQLERSEFKRNLRLLNF